MKIGRIREKVKRQYPNDKWAKKVDAMPDNQVVAIYLSLKERGEFDKPVRKWATYPDNSKTLIEKYREDILKDPEPVQLDCFAKIGVLK